MIVERAMEYRLPLKSTPEDLELRLGRDEGKMLLYGDKILATGYYYEYGNSGFYGAIYEFLTGDTSCEGELGLRNVSEDRFKDDGHAIAWAMQNI